MRVSKRVMCLAASAASLVPLHAAAATLCVSSDGSLPCYAHIGDAVAAAAPGDVIQVNAGTYYESIGINKPLSLITQNAIIDAGGLSRGIFVDGLFTTNLSNVNISGFTIRNASFEGVLVVNASAVSITENTVVNNNQGLSGGQCLGLEAFETNEQSDCGEGIHLMGADHSIVSHNTVQGNSGGILISDDTGPTHHNLVSFNSVSNNPYACGITMASHAPFGYQVQVVKPINPINASSRAAAAIGPISTSFGVFSNTVYGNRSSQNGLANGGGSGVGIFASIPGAQAYSNVVVDNYLTQNGLPGIALHAHAPGQILNDNMLVGNTLVGNGADTRDAYTPGPTGINVYTYDPAPGNMISANNIQNEAYDVVVKDPAPVQVQGNALQGNGVGVANQGTGAVNATMNFWSCPNGPTLVGSCSTVSGSNVQWAPWLTQQIPGQPSF